MDESEAEHKTYQPLASHDCGELVTPRSYGLMSTALNEDKFTPPPVGRQTVPQHELSSNPSPCVHLSIMLTGEFDLLVRVADLFQGCWHEEAAGGAGGVQARRLQDLQGQGSHLQGQVQVHGQYFQGQYFEGLQGDLFSATSCAPLQGVQLEGSWCATLRLARWKQGPSRKARLHCDRVKWRCSLAFASQVFCIVLKFISRGLCVLIFWWIRTSFHLGPNTIYNFKKQLNPSLGNRSAVQQALLCHQACGVWSFRRVPQRASNMEPPWWGVQGVGSGNSPCRVLFVEVITRKEWCGFTISQHIFVRGALTLGYRVVWRPSCWILSRWFVTRSPSCDRRKQTFLVEGKRKTKHAMCKYVYHTYE